MYQASIWYTDGTTDTIYYEEVAADVVRIRFKLANEVICDVSWASVKKVIYKEKSHG